ncbi:uncharacterized protein LOC125045597, partial [Penaeus chinensis]|uniref:uncharacterized protein LOC125045597 n=1 Tax=Penaeus chinensis TaxID=139456 RepID=UPI001FB6F8EE
MSHRLSGRGGPDKHLVAMSRRFLFFWKTKAKTKRRPDQEEALGQAEPRPEVPTSVKIAPPALSESITPEELIRKRVQIRSPEEMKTLLTESINAETVLALCDHLDVKFPDALLFKKGEVI